MTSDTAMAKISVSDIKPGAVLRILGENAQGKRETWYGQAQEVYPDQGTLEVALLTPKGDLLELRGDGYVPQDIPVESVLAFEPIEDLESKREHKKAWYRIGVRLLSSSAEGDTFIALDREDVAGDHDIGDDESDSDFEVSGSDSDDSLGSLRDFIVDDEPEAEPFSHAKPADPEIREGGAERVRDIHQAVRDYNNWVPETEREKRGRAFIEGFEAKYAAKDDERQFARGTSVAYSKPPTGRGAGRGAGRQ